MSATRKNMNADSLNMLLFLKANKHIIQKILNERKIARLNDDDKDDEDGAEIEIDEDSGFIFKYNTYFI